MKKLMLISVMLICAVSLNAQDKITGFGKLKLGMSVSQIDELKTAEKMSNYMDWIRKVYDNHSNQTVYEMIPDTTVQYKSNVLGSFDSRVRVFDIPSIQITENIEIESVELKFFNDKLFSIKCGISHDVSEALVEPKLDVKKDLPTHIQAIL